MSQSDTLYSCFGESGDDLYPAQILTSVGLTGRTLGET